MKISISLFLILFGFLAFGQKKHICFSIDDLPIVSYGMNDTIFQKKIFDKLIISLKVNNIPAIGFVNEKKLFKNDTIIPFQYRLLENWINNGLDLGNHTFSHPDYNKVSFDAYTRDISKGEILTKELLKCKGKSLKYFRHPFLHTGPTREKADSLASFLKNNGYLEAFVTIDDDDYLFALAYKRAMVKKDSILVQQIGRDYISYMEKKLLYFEKQSGKLFGRNISQVLLIHASMLNADYIDSLAEMFRNNNYDFVSMDTALEDEAYKNKVTAYGNWGISWIDRWAISSGKKGDFFKEDPVTPDYIVQLAN
jgi:peptidoglycan/xylan/chitin deacetylase (PgdA/CDA1 family)